MMDIFESTRATNAAEYTVSELSVALKRTVEDAFGNVRVRGEISGYRGPHSSGHAYFALKDDRARLEAVIWKTTMGRLKFRPEEGMEVIATGKLTTYPGSSKYQIVIDNLEPAGAGALMALLEERKRRLAAEGLFEAARKRPLPFMPRVIGVITSPTGAVIRDIIHRIKDRYPLTLLVWPVRVQGETTGAEVAAAVNGFNALAADGPIVRPDLLIVARGGGSLEDLWGFNDEALARTVAASEIPVISAVGHETDWTLIDFVADMRAPTPTGAAEIAVPVKAELEAGIANFLARLRGCLSRHIERKQQALRAAARVLPTPDQLFAMPRRRFDEAASRLDRGLAVSTERKRARLAVLRMTPATLERRIAEARRDLDRHTGRSLACLRAGLRERSTHLSRAAARLNIDSLARRQIRAAESLAALQRRREQAISVSLERLRSRLTQADRLLSTHMAMLERGYAVVTDANGDLIRKAEEITPGMRLSLHFSDGIREAIASGASGTAKPRAKPAEKAIEKQSESTQGSLF